MAETPRSSFRIPLAVKEKARKVADSHDEDLTAVVVEALDRYAAKGVKRVRKPRAKDTVVASGE